MCSAARFLPTYTRPDVVSVGSSRAQRAQPTILRQLRALPRHLLVPRALQPGTNPGERASAGGRLVLPRHFQLKHNQVLDQELLDDAGFFVQAPNPSHVYGRSRESPPEFLLNRRFRIRSSVRGDFRSAAAFQLRPIQQSVEAGRRLYRLHPRLQNGVTEQRRHGRLLLRALDAFELRLRLRPVCGV